MVHDKKFAHDRQRFILLNALGKAFVAEDVATDMLRDCVADYTQ